MSDDEWLDRKSAARYLAELGFPLAPGTLANMAQNRNAGNGPPFTYFRNKIRYKKSEIEGWLRTQMRSVR